VAEESQAMPVGDVSKKEKQAAKAAGEAEAARQAAEDAEWAEGGKKANKKKEAEAEKKAAKAERKAENDALAEAEEAELSAPKLTGNKAKPAKMTRAEIAAQAMVIKQNGKTPPAKTGPEPSINFVIAGICSVGQITRIATAKKPTAPIFKKELK
jgi:hypothetical protein